jgi:hypothetical protein
MPLIKEGVTTRYVFPAPFVNKTSKITIGNDVSMRISLLDAFFVTAWTVVDVPVEKTLFVMAIDNWTPWTLSPQFLVAEGQFG